MRPLNGNEEAVTPPGRGELRRVGVMLLLVGGLHIPSLFNPFFIDDYVYLDTVHDLDWAGLADLVTTSTMGAKASSVWWTPAGALPFYRPLGELAFAVDYAVWGLKPFGCHLTNLVLHLLCVFLTWRLVRRLTDSPQVAFVAATLFAIHPVHCEAVLWISSRFDLLACAAVITSVLAYFNWQGGGRGAWRWGVASVACYVIGLGCKETALILPAVVVAGECLRWRGRDGVYHVGRLAAAALAFCVTSILYLVGRFAMFDGLGTLPPPYGLDTSSPLAACKTLGWNLSQYLLDFCLFIQVDAIYLADFWARHPAVLVLLVAVCLLIIVLCARVAWHAAAFRVGLVWAMLFTAPCLMAMPGERNVYLASVGVAVVGAAALVALQHRVRWRPKARGRVRWWAKVVAAICVVIVLNEHLIMWVVASTGEKVYRDLETQLPLPPDARIYVVHQCPLNAVGFQQAINLRLGREDIRAVALSLAPTVEYSSDDVASRTGTNSIRIDRKNGYFFKSFVERFHLFGHDSAADLADAARRVQIELLDPPTTVNDLTRIELKLPYPLEDPRVHLFVWNNRDIQSKADYIRLHELTRLEPIDPIDLRQSDKEGSRGGQVDGLP